MKTHSRIIIVLLLVTVLMLSTSIFGVSAQNSPSKIGKIPEDSIQMPSSVAQVAGYHSTLYTDIITNDNAQGGDIAISNPTLLIGSSGIALSIGRDANAQTFSIVPTNGNTAGLIIPITNQGYGLSVLGALKTNDVNVLGDLTASGALSGASVNAGSVTATGSVTASNGVYTNKVYAVSLNGASVNTGAVTASSVTASGALSGASVNAGSVIASALLRGAAVNANVVSAGSVSADLVTANTVTTTTLNADVIQADKICLGGDCITSWPSGPPPNLCGNGVIDSGERCDNGTANTNTACSPGYGGVCTYCDTSCVDITMIGDYCGDGACNADETSTSCSIDCPRSQICGDGTCSGTETCNSCSADCGDCGIGTGGGGSLLMMKSCGDCGGGGENGDNGPNWWQIFCSQNPRRCN